MKKEIKNKLVFAVKISVTCAILYYVFNKMDISAVASSISQISLNTILILIGTALIKQAIEIINWANYLKINPEYKITFKELISSHFIGHSLRFVVPGGYATVGKMYFVNNKKKATLLSVGIEKFFQIWLVLLFASFATHFYFREISFWIKAGASLIILTLPFLIYFVHHFSHHEEWKSYFRNYMQVMPRIAALQVFYMFITVLQYFIILKAFGAITYFETLIGVSLVLFANIIPVTYAGLGLRESFAMEILPKFGVASEFAISASLIVFFFNTALPAIMGVFLFLARKRK